MPTLISAHASRCWAGGVFIAIGHLLIALVEGPSGQQGGYLSGFYAGLAFIIVGTGFLKANISVLVGQLYPRNDTRRDGAFSIFYMGINLGAFIGPLLVGYLGERVGWSYGFGAAGVGMLLGLVVFVLFQRDLHGAGAPAQPGAVARAHGDRPVARMADLRRRGPDRRHRLAVDPRRERRRYVAAGLFRRHLFSTYSTARCSPCRASSGTASSPRST